MGALGRLELGACLDRTDACDEAAEGGRDGGRAGGSGDVERVRGAVAGPGATDGKPLGIGARVFMRDDDVGIVSLRAAGLEDGVEGLVGGTMYSRPYRRLVVAVCAFALDDAVGVSYRATGALPDAAEPDPEPDA